jgi:hypothetical protein
MHTTELASVSVGLVQLNHLGVQHPGFLCASGNQSSMFRAPRIQSATRCSFPGMEPDGGPRRRRAHLH